MYNYACEQDSEISAFELGKVGQRPAVPQLMVPVSARLFPSYFQGTPVPSVLIDRSLSTRRSSKSRVSTQDSDFDVLE